VGAASKNCLCGVWKVVLYSERREVWLTVSFGKVCTAVRKLERRQSEKDRDEWRVDVVGRARL
jgi:hypothetical protein